MKTRLSRIITSILILFIALPTFAVPASAQSQANEILSNIGTEAFTIETRLTSFSADIKTQPLSAGNGLEKMPANFTERFFIYSELNEQAETIPSSPKNIAETQLQVKNFDCSTVNDVPKIECEALVAIYSSTNGADWKENTNWLNSTTVGNWYGITVESGKVKVVDLFYNNLNGSIPSAVGNLSGLTNLDFSLNQLSGSIPKSLGNLSQLRYLYFTGNEMSGNIPSELGNLSNLAFLDLGGGNNFSGTIPSTFGNLTNLMGLDLGGGNELSGKIPSFLGNLPRLEFLYLQSNHEMDGKIPSTFLKLKLYAFHFYGTKICEPSSAEFLAWKKTVKNWSGTNITCADDPVYFMHIPMVYKGR